MFHDECGVFAVFDPQGNRTDAARLSWYGLFALQHRGQDSSGIAVNHGGTILCQRNRGLLVEGFDDVALNMMQGHAAIGHVRYPLQGDPGLENAQPMLIKYRAGQVALAMNGSLTNSDGMRRQLQENGAIFQTGSDAEIMLAMLARNRILTDHIEDAVRLMIRDLKGAYAVVVMTPEKILGFRDPLGIRPLCLGRLDDTWLLASEDCAFEAMGGTFVRDVLPGEIISLAADGLQALSCMADTGQPLAMKQVDGSCAKQAGPAGLLDDNRPEREKNGQGKVCLFEFVYFARPDSTIDGANVYLSRLRAGELLAGQHPCNADLVIGAPDSGLAASVGYARQSGLAYGQGLLKNRYVGRTFMQPDQLKREATVFAKFSALKEIVRGKRLVMVDDSLVRGTTMRHIVGLLKKAGALEVHLRIASPPVMYPCFYGVDTPCQAELTASNMSQEQIREMIGADSIGYLSLEGLCSATVGLRGGHCTACFDGSFPAGLPDSQKNKIRQIDPAWFYAGRDLHEEHPHV